MYLSYAISINLRYTSYHLKEFFNNLTVNFSKKLVFYVLVKILSFVMKRLNTEKIILQKKKNLKILRVNLKIKNQKKFFKRTAKKIYSEIFFTGQLAIFKAVNRAELLDNIKKIQNWTINDKPLYLDFSKLTRLDACSTSLFVHNLNKYQNVNMKGKASKKNVVRSMLTKLGVHQKLGLKNYYCNQAKVNKWCIAKGTNSDLTNGYEVIENVLMDHFSLENEEFYIINEAISEAINNVVDHAYAVIVIKNG